MLKKFCEVSSCNGVIDLYEAKNNRYQLAFWATVMTCMLGASIYFTYATIKGYVNTPTVTNVVTVPQKIMNLPEVAIGFNGGMNISAMLAANLSLDLVKVFASGLYLQPTEDNNNELEIFRLTNNLSMQDTYEKFSYRCHEEVDYFWSANDISDEYGSNCNQATDIWGKVGIWYLFHSKGKQVSVIEGGIAITLKEMPFNFQNVYSDDELIEIQMTNSYSIIIQKSFDNHLSFEGVISIPLQSIVNIALNPKRYVRLSKCDSSNQTYNSDTCVNNCYQAAFVESCKCRSVEIGSDAKPQQFDYCNLYTNFNCTKSEGYFEQCLDSCLPKCDEWVFEYQYSINMYPNIDFKGKSKSTVNIYYSKMLYTKIEEVEAFTMDMAVANVGGQCGLWLGASFVTIVQAVYYLLLTVAEKIAKTKEAKTSVIIINSEKSSD